MPTIIDRVKSYKDACKIKGIEPLTQKDFAFLPKKQQKGAFATHQLETIIDVLNEGKKPNWQNSDTKKWYPVFDLEVYNDGRENDGFSFHIVGYLYDCTDVSSRLCFVDEEKANYAGKQFLKIYKNMML